MPNDLELLEVDPEKQLAIYEQKKKEIEEATDPVELSEDSKISQLAIQFAKDRNYSLEVQNRIADLKIRQERKAAILFDQLEKGQGQRTDLTLSKPGQSSEFRKALKKAKIKRQTFHRWLKQTEMPDNEYENWVDKQFESNDEITSHKLRQYIKAKKKEEKRAKRQKEYQQLSKQFNDLDWGESIQVYPEKFQECKAIESESLDAIITDPPYGKKHLDKWKDLSRFASQSLKPSGFLFTYAGNTHLPIYHKHLSTKLDYFWTYALLLKGAKQRLNNKAVQTGYKPILIYQRPPHKLPPTDFQDVLEGSGREKDDYEWQQGVEELTPIIKSFTKPNDLICDPMAGTGTTLLACLNLKRRVIGIEIDKDRLNVIKGRLMHLHNERG